MYSGTGTTQPKGRRYYWKSEYLPGLKPDLLAKTIGHAKAIPSPHSATLLFPLDGALNRFTEDHSAVGNRDAAWVINIASSWEKAEDDRTDIEWARGSWEDIRGFSTGGTYINFLTEEEVDNRIRAAYRKNYYQATPKTEQASRSGMLSGSLILKHQMGPG